MTTVGLLGTGMMGAAVARTLVGHGHRVVTAKGRSAASEQRSTAAGVELLADVDAVVGTAELVLSIVPPAAAAEVGRAVAAAVGRAGRPVIFADANALAPGTVQAMAAELTAAGARFADLAIMGGPPKGDTVPYMPASGPAAAEVVAALAPPLDVRDIGGPVGRASALKMCYAAMTKGGTALYTALLTAAERLGVADELGAYVESATPRQLAIMNGALPPMVSKSARWVPEMHEIAATFESVGLPPAMMRGAAEVFTLVADTYGDEPAADPPRALAARLAARLDGHG